MTSIDNIYTGRKKFHVGEWFLVLNDKRPLSDIVEKFLNLSKDVIVPLEAEIRLGGTEKVRELRTSKNPIKTLVKYIKQLENTRAAFISVYLYAGVNILTEKNKVVFFDENSCIETTHPYYPFEIRIWHEQNKSKKEIYFIIRAKINVFLPKTISKSSKDAYMANPKTMYDPSFDSNLYTENNEKLSNLNVPILNNIIKKTKTEFSKEIIEEPEPEPGPTEAITEKIGYKVVKDGIKIIAAN